MKVLHSICIIFALCTKYFCYEAKITHYPRPYRCIRLRIWRTDYPEQDTGSLAPVRLHLFGRCRFTSSQTHSLLQSDKGIPAVNLWNHLCFDTVSLTFCQGVRTTTLKSQLNIVFCILYEYLQNNYHTIIIT